MMEDALLELTSNPGTGQAVTVDAYGGSPYNLGVAGVDPAVGEPLDLFYQVTEDFATAVSLAINVIHDDDGVGTNKATLLTTGAVVLANLTVAAGAKRIGRIGPQQITKKYLGVFLDISTTATAGKVRVWAQKGLASSPVNAGAM